jgi:hypothetical protein
MRLVSELVTSGIQKFISKFTLVVLSIPLGPLLYNPTHALFTL